MLTAEQNKLLTEVGPSTPLGRTFRRYWLPALLSEELVEPDGPPRRVRILGEDLIAFRDSDGVVGIVGAFCPHRRAPMFFGRNEEHGLRCVYHGWKFDRTGSCVDMPSEPADSLFKTKVSIDAYPTWEGGGMIWIYMGPAEQMPAYPDYEVVRTPETHRFVSKTFQECNYLQALEGGLDASHATIMHNMNIGDLSFLNDYTRTIPHIDVEPTDYGYMYTGVRKLDVRQWVRAYHYIMPVGQVRGKIADPAKYLDEGRVPTINGHFWVPVDDTHCCTYNYLYSYDPARAIPPELAIGDEKKSGRGPDDLDPNDKYRLKRTLANDYLIDRDVQKHKTFTGIPGLNTQDVALQEGMGPIVDRTKEHLGTTDRAIIVMRQLLLEAVQTAESGGTPRGVDPSTYRTVRALDHIIPGELDWHVELAPELVAKF
jgi:phthalate 4,5-dioxygenase